MRSASSFMGVVQAKMLCSILAHSTTSIPANTFFSVATGKRWASFAPRGAKKVLTTETSTSAGRYT